jgi:hypothetical protein
VKQKKPRFCFIVAKNGWKQNRVDLTGAIFSGEVILPETSPEMSKQNFVLM